jgi:hypothetical protein
MITITILFLIMYGLSIRAIYKASGSWKEFDPIESSFIWHLIFMVSTSLMTLFFVALIVHGITSGIIP